MKKNKQSIEELIRMANKFAEIIGKKCDEIAKAKVELETDKKFKGGDERCKS